MTYDQERERARAQVEAYCDRYDIRLHPLQSDYARELVRQHHMQALSHAGKGGGKSFGIEVVHRLIEELNAEFDADRDQERVDRGAPTEAERRAGDEWLNLSELIDRLTRGDRVGAAAYLSSRGPFAHVHPETALEVVDAIAVAFNTEATEAERRAAQDLPESWRVGGTIDDHGERRPPVWVDPIGDIGRWLGQMAEHSEPDATRDAVVVVPQGLLDAIPDLGDQLDEHARRMGFAGVDLRTHEPGFNEAAREAFADDGTFTVGRHGDSTESWNEMIERRLKAHDTRFESLRDVLSDLEDKSHEPVDIESIVDRKLETYDVGVGQEIERVVARKIDEFESRVEGAIKTIAADVVREEISEALRQLQITKLIPDLEDRVNSLSEHIDRQAQRSATLVRDIARDEYRHMTNDPQYREWVKGLILEVRGEVPVAERGQRDIEEYVQRKVRDELSGLGDMISQAFLGNSGT